MAKKTARSSRSSSRSTSRAVPKGDYELVIVESPAKAKTIEKYLGPGFAVKASVGHIRDLPSRTPKGSKQLVPGVDLEHDFAPAYEIDAAKDRTVNGTFASVASVRRSLTAVLRPSGGRGRSRVGRKTPKKRS